MTWSKKRHEKMLRATCPPLEEEARDLLDFTRRVVEALGIAADYVEGDVTKTVDELLDEWEGEE